MTQKEYKEEIEKYKNKIEKLEKQLSEANTKVFNYEKVLEDCVRANVQLEEERRMNEKNTWVINEQNKLIAKYEAMINRVTLSAGE